MKTNFLDAYVCVICGSNSMIVTKDMGKRYQCPHCRTEYVSSLINNRLVMQILTEYEDVGKEMDKWRHRT